MDCRHEHLRTVGDRVFCCECKAELPLEFLMAKNNPVKDEKQAEKADPVEKTDKPTSRKGRPKKAV
jgi:hypothetical protein